MEIFIGFGTGLIIGLLVGLVITFFYLKFKVARLTASAQAAAIEFATGRLKDAGIAALKARIMRGKANAEEAVG